MKELGGRPHWAKNFGTVTKEDFNDMYPSLGDWLRVRNEVDPNGMFVGDWHVSEIGALFLYSGQIPKKAPSLLECTEESNVDSQLYHRGGICSGTIRTGYFLKRQKLAPHQQAQADSTGAESCAPNVRVRKPARKVSS